jgi:ligand-binding SRPBCC domain-containing protein
VFDFFSDARQLAVITPRWLGFEIRTPLPTEMKRGARIEYRIRLVGIPVSWTTVIQVWEPPHRFVDVQERGPYAHWEHTHHFLSLANGVLMSDRVRYALPFGPLGRIVHRIAVRPALALIFDFRFERIQQIFGSSAQLAVDLEID